MAETFPKPWRPWTATTDWMRGIPGHVAMAMVELREHVEAVERELVGVVPTLRRDTYLVSSRVAALEARERSLRAVERLESLEARGLGAGVVLGRCVYRRDHELPCKGMLERVGEQPCEDSHRCQRYVVLPPGAQTIDKEPVLRGLKSAAEVRAEAEYSAPCNKFLPLPPGAGVLAGGVPRKHVACGLERDHPGGCRFTIGDEAMRAIAAAGDAVRAANREPGVRCTIKLAVLPEAEPLSNRQCVREAGHREPCRFDLAANEVAALGRATQAWQDAIVMGTRDHLPRPPAYTSDEADELVMAVHYKLQRCDADPVGRRLGLTPSARALLRRHLMGENPVVTDGERFEQVPVPPPRWRKVRCRLERGHMGDHVHDGAPKVVVPQCDGEGYVIPTGSVVSVVNPESRPRWLGDPRQRYDQGVRYGIVWPGNVFEYTPKAPAVSADVAAQVLEDDAAELARRIKEQVEADEPTTVRGRVVAGVERAAQDMLERRTGSPLKRHGDPMAEAIERRGEPIEPGPFWRTVVADVRAELGDALIPPSRGLLVDDDMPEVCVLLEGHQGEHMRQCQVRYDARTVGDVRCGWTARKAGPQWLGAWVWEAPPAPRCVQFKGHAGEHRLVRELDQVTMPVASMRCDVRVRRFDAAGVPTWTDAGPIPPTLRCPDAWMSSAPFFNRAHPCLGVKGHAGEHQYDGLWAGCRCPNEYKRMPISMRDPGGLERCLLTWKHDGPCVYDDGSTSTARALARMLVEQHEANAYRRG